MIKNGRGHWYGVLSMINSGRCSKCRKSKCVFIDKGDHVFVVVN